MKKETRAVFIADDGKIFDDEKDCQKYEEAIKKREKKTSYWIVTHNPDLTEGRGYYGITFLEVYGPEHGAELWVRDFCFRKFGRPIAFVQGVSAIANWSLSKADREKFLQGGSTSVGDYAYKADTLRLICGKREEGLVEVREIKIDTP